VRRSCDLTVAVGQRRGKAGATVLLPGLARAATVGAFGGIGMDFCILGPLEVFDDGRRVAVGGARQRALLAVLVIHANETLGTERLIDELWGERPPATATKTVQVHISRLRKALEPSGSGRREMLVTRENGYELQVEPERIDSHRFEQLIVAGRRELVAGRPGRALSLLEEALSLWRGPPLVEFSYERVAQAEIARLDELRVGALEELIEAKLALGRHAEAVAALEGLIREHPYRERLRAQLMLALYRCDRQADALQAYQNARRMLVEELGIEPGQRLRELEAGILTQDQSLTIAGRSRAAEEPIAEVMGPVFVGRQAELAELLGGLDDAFAGHGRLFLLVGEPGVGKSRLAEELTRHARARGARLLMGRCWEAGGAPAFWPWVQSLRLYLQASDRDDLVSQLGPGAADVAAIVPELYDLIPGLAPRTAPDSEGARFRLFHATAEFLRRASQTDPVVLVLDDLHAADTPSLLMLQFIARELASMHVLVIAAMRDVDPVPGERLTAMTTELAREPVMRRISLRGFSESEVAEYVQLTAAEAASAELAAELHAETEGNPLFVAELVRLSSLEGVRHEPGRAVRLAIPQSVRDVISRRLAHLPPDCHRILELASVLGREVDVEPLARMADVSVDMLLDTLDAAIAARVFDDGPGVADRIRFAHVLIRDTLYDRLTIARRVRMHRLAVDALAALYGDDAGAHLAELAHHAIAARDFERALRYAWRAGDLALALLAFEEAARLYQRALDALERPVVADEKSRCELLLSLGEAQGRAGNTPAAKAAFIDAADIARRLGLSRELARAAVGYGGRTAWMRVAGDIRLVPLLEEGLDAVGAVDVELRVRLLARLAGALRDEPSRERRDRLSQQAVELARRSGSPAALAYALDGRTEVILAPDTVDECFALGDELCDVAQRIGDKERLVHGRMDRFVVRVLLGDIQAARTDLAAMSAIAEELRQPVQLWQASIAQAMLALALGMLSHSEKLIAQALALGERPLPQMAIPAHRVQWCTLCEFRGELERVESSIRDLVADYPSRPVFRCLLAHLQAQLGQTTDARQALKELASEQFSTLPFDQEWLYGMALLAETASTLHDSDASSVIYRLLKPWERLNAVDHPEAIRGSVSRYLGLVAATLERLDEAAAHYEAALTLNAKMGVRPWLAHTKNDYARMLLARHKPGDRQRALRLIGDARTTYLSLEMNTWAGKASELEQTVRLSAATE
jgi:DNA-binding SARP family transcriptional activator